MNDEFFVGYLPMPRGLARCLRWIVGGSAAVVITIAFGLALFQHGYANSSFEFGQYRAFEGVLLDQPYPILLVARPGETKGAASAFSSYLLVDQFKHGADAQVHPFAGRRVRLQGQLIYREDETMLELKPGSVEALEPGAGPSAAQLKSLGPVTVTGEIVDSKCYLGVMNPGNGKVHRDCAARCISGGVPAAFVATDQAHAGSVYLLRSAKGEKLSHGLAAHIGERITLHGESLRLGDQLFLLLDV